MALKEYELNGSTYKFEDGRAPKGAKLIDRKAAKPAANKARTPRNKAAKPAANKAPDASVEAASDPDASE